MKACNILLSKNYQRPVEDRKLHLYSSDDIDANDSLNSLIDNVNEVEELQLTDSEIQCSLNYYFRKGTEELKSYVHPKFYQNESYEKDGIMYYTGRVSVSDISFHSDLTDKIIDLSKKSFVVPIVDRHSPLAYAIVNEIHWNDKTVRHTGVETTIRAVMSVAHILKVRSLVKIFRENCKRCRFLLRRTVEVIMGPASKDQLHVAPPFYVTQMDICGPFKAYSIHNKRASVKIYIATFVCCTTGTMSLKIMEGLF